MASPFELFRKNQKTLLSLLLIFAMFAFILADMLTGDSLNLPMLGLVLGAAIFTVFGWFKGRPIPYAAGGALGGLLAGWIMVQTGARPGSQYVLETKVGNLTPAEFQGLAQQRNVVNEFISRAQQAAGTNQMGGISFSQQLEQDIALRMIFRDLAEENGIRVDKKAVANFITTLTTPLCPAHRGRRGGRQLRSGTQLTNEDYHKILSDMRISDSQLTRALQSELLAVAGRQQFLPATDRDPGEVLGKLSQDEPDAEPASGRRPGFLVCRLNRRSRRQLASGVF